MKCVKTVIYLIISSGYDSLHGVIVCKDTTYCVLLVENTHGNVCAVRDFFRRDVGRKFGGSTHFFVDKTTITRLLYVNVGVYIFRIGPKNAGFSFVLINT